MDIQHLLDAESYQPDHKLRFIHDRLLAHACHTEPLAGLLEAAWEAGYAAHEREEADRLVCPAPPANLMSEDDAKRLLALLADPWMRLRSHGVWSWDSERFGWRIEGDDCLIRPGDGGLIIMKAGGEFSGQVLIEVDRDTRAVPRVVIAEFGEDTFR